MALSMTVSNLGEGSVILDPTGATVIAIDKDKNSQQAVKWAVDHLLKSSSFTLIHVRTKRLHPHDVDAIHKEGFPPTEEELQQFFLPFRGLCARKGIAAKELVLQDPDVSSALTDYIINNSIRNLVVGASNRNALMRKLKDADVPTRLVKSVPESCTIHVISKGKVQNIKPTGHQCISVTSSTSVRDTSNPQENSQSDHLHKLPTPDSEEAGRNSFGHGCEQGLNLDGVSSGQNHNATQKVQHKPNGEANSPRKSMEISSPNSSSQNPYSFISDMSEPPSFKSNDKLHENKEAFGNSDSPSYSKTLKGLEAEIRKLKLELKKTMEKYSSACKEAISAKQRAIELEHIREEEERNLEKARLAEEAALALAEVEREKTRVALESAHMAKRLAEMETEKRKHAEMRAMHEQVEREKAVNALAHNYIKCRKYNISDIEVATNYFDNALKIGEGGYGPVFKGVLDHTVVAIKVLRPDIASGERQFLQEVEVLSNIRHPNMVLLLGACPEYGCLVYEYLENGSLEDRLFQKDNTPPIPWKLRFKIAAEIATGLHFLHQTKPEPLVHRDLKPANILLDMNYKSKISDVGLARLVPPSVADKTTQYRLTAAAGTFCYIDPEYQQTGLLGVKSDIYSLGVLLLQVITGKPPMGLAHQVDKAIQAGKFPEVLDPSVTDWPVEEALSCAMLALKCCELRKRDRPSLGSVILPELDRLKDLEGDTNNGDSPVRKMIVRRRQGQSLKSLTNKWRSRIKLRERSLLAATGNHVRSKSDSDDGGGCCSFVTCPNPCPTLKKFYSFSGPC